MKLRKAGSKVLLEAGIESISIKDYKWIEKSKEYLFDWSTEKTYEVYKLFLLENDNNILGLMSLIDIPQEFRIHLNLLEVSKANQGRTKKIEGIAACLIAFAAEQAFKRAYFGFVSLEPKTVLIEHYKKAYGFEQYGRYLAIEGVSSQLLIEKYLGDE